MCKDPVVMCSFMSSFYLFIQQICIECQPYVYIHRGYKVKNNGVYIECLSHLRLNSALVTNNPQISVAYCSGLLFPRAMCSLLVAERRETLEL